jgi:hypothetical protein
VQPPALQDGSGTGRVFFPQQAQQQMTGPDVKESHMLCFFGGIA